MPVYDVPLILHKLSRATTPIEADNWEDAKALAEASIGTYRIYAPDLEWTEEDDYMVVADEDEG